MTTLSRAARVESPASMRRLPASSVNPCPFSIMPAWADTKLTYGQTLWVRTEGAAKRALHTKMGTHSRSDPEDAINATLHIELRTAKSAAGVGGPQRPRHELGRASSSRMATVRARFKGQGAPADTAGSSTATQDAQRAARAATVASDCGCPEISTRTGRHACSGCSSPRLRLQSIMAPSEC